MAETRKVICSYCGAYISGSIDDKVASHGCCATCFPKQLEEIKKAKEEYKKRKKGSGPNGPEPKLRSNPDIFFDLGEIRVHPEAEKAVGEDFIYECLEKHRNLDYGGVDEKFKKLNSESILRGEGIIFSAYKLGTKILVIRSVISKTQSVVPDRNLRAITAISLREHLKLSPWGQRNINPDPPVSENPAKSYLETLVGFTSGEQKLFYKFQLDNLRRVEMAPTPKKYRKYAKRYCMPKGCWNNSALLSSKYPEVNYSEGWTIVSGLPIEHAWCELEGQYFDPTIEFLDNEDLKHLPYYLVQTISSQEITQILKHQMWELSTPLRIWFHDFRSKT